MSNIEKLGKNISEQLVNGKKLLDCSDLLLEYEGMDWKEHIKYSDTSPYTKIQVFVNEHVEIDVLSWKPSRSCKIHDHPENGCLLRVMENYLIENIYINENNKPKFVETKQLNVNQISYKAGNKYLHNIDNPSDNYSITLHVYSPPNYKLNYY